MYQQRAGFSEAELNEGLAIYNGTLYLSEGILEFSTVDDKDIFMLKFS